MRKIYTILLACILLFSFAGCSNSTTTEKSEANTQESARQESTETQTKKAESKPLVIYFSCTGNTKEIALEIQKRANADIFEIVPTKPYSADDLNYNDENCRANREMNDETARPQIKNNIENIDDYDTVFIGYPIWWGTCPRIINTLLDTYDFSGKTIIPFCTSGSSGISKSVSTIKEAEPNAKVKNGLRVSSASDLDDWLEDELKSEQ